MNSCCQRLGLCGVLIGLALGAGAQEWTRFRGPNGTGISSAKSVPAVWTDANYSWKVPLPGSGHSSPVLWGNKLFLTCGGENNSGLVLMCLNAQDGSTLWSKAFPFPPHPLHKFNDMASSSPVVDAERVYLYWAQPQSQTLLALTHDGTKVWEHELGAFKSQHGGGTSPVLHQGKIILSNEQDGQSFIVALQASTGKELWKTPRETSTTAYSTPCVFQPKGEKPSLIFNSQSHGIYSVDPDTGKVLWEFTKAFDKRSVSSPVVASGLLIGSCGSGGGGNYVVAVRPPAKPGGQPELAYEIRKSAPYVPTSLAVEDLLFLWGDGGIVTCLYAPTGEIKWQERVGGNFFGSPVFADGRIYCVSTAGEVVVIKASDQFEVIARNKLNELSHATPAVANGRMFIRTEKHLVCIGSKTS